MSDAMTKAQARVAERVLCEEDAKRLHFVVHLSGAHAYGFASVDSDLDLKAIHVAPTRDFLGLRKIDPSASRMGTIDGVEVDYTSNEIGQALAGLLRGDGNMLERVMSATPLRAHPRLGELVELAGRTLSKRYFHHYRGFATSQRERVDAEAPSAKRVLYVLRTALTGAHLLETGICNPDSSALCDAYDFSIAHELIERKRAAETSILEAGILERIPALLDAAFARLELAATRSSLPDEPRHAEELERWLVELRMQMSDCDAATF